MQTVEAMAMKGGSTATLRSGITKKLAQREAQVIARKARLIGGDVMNIANNVAARFGGKTSGVNYKSEGSIVRKLIDDGKNGKFGAVNDSVRTTIIVERKNLNKVYAALQKHPNFMKGTHQNFSSGYSGKLLNFKIRGVTGEIQINTPDMIYAKEKKMHAYKMLGKELYLKTAKKYQYVGGTGHQYYESLRQKPYKGTKRQKNKENQRSYNYYKSYRG